MGSERLERAAFWVTVILAGATVWIAPRPPLADLPQHAGQIQLWHDIVLGTSKWASLFYVNYFTPYLVGCGLALLLSFVMPVTAALKLLITLAYIAFVAACILMRRQVGGDRRLDWLFIPGFFGLAFFYGLFPFLVALPIGMAFIALAYRYAGQPTIGLALWLCAAGVAMFFSHGLVFLFANAIGAAFLLVRWRSVGSFVAAVVPFAVLAALCAAYYLAQHGGAQQPSAVVVRADWPGPLNALSYLLFPPMGAPDKDWANALVVPLLLATPWIMGCRLNEWSKAAIVPLILLLLGLAVVPEAFMETFFVTTRFAVFLLPFYALLFRPSRASQGAWGLAVATGAAMVCLGFVAVQAGRMVDFARESAAFDDILAAAEPGHRAQQLVTDMGSPAARTPMAYSSFPLWYQVDKAGLVDFNFAVYATQVVRYRDIKAETGIPRERYRYFFVRRTDSLPADFLQSPTCRPVLKKESGGWMLFENVDCTN